MRDIQVISAADLLAEKRAQPEMKTLVPWQHGKVTKYVDKVTARGEMEVIELDKPYGELLTSAAGAESIIQKTVLDLELGRETQPLLYQPIYRRRENRGFTRWVEIGGPNGRAHSVFIEHLEGQEVMFGTRTLSSKETVPILTYTNGFQWTEDMEEFDLTWEAEEANRSIGEAYNAVLNHLHLFPIIDYAYAAKNITAAITTAATQYENDRATIRKALQDAALDINTDTGRGRTPTIILAHSSNRFRITEALQQRQIGGTIFEPIGQQLTTVILYDGWSDTVGQKPYVYGGTPTTHIFLIEPTRYFQELVKHDLRVDVGDGDLTRLINNAIVARARRGVYAAPANAVQKVALP